MVVIILPTWILSGLICPPNRKEIGNAHAPQRACLGFQMDLAGIIYTHIGELKAVGNFTSIYILGNQYILYLLIYISRIICWGGD